tara:strand:- start:505 stop:684 length:180 start_codon:yes stop_codon:yes gene_type:complete
MQPTAIFYESCTFNRNINIRITNIPKPQAKKLAQKIEHFSSNRIASNLSDTSLWCRSIN